MKLKNSKIGVYISLLLFFCVVLFWMALTHEKIKEISSIKIAKIKCDTLVIKNSVFGMIVPGAKKNVIAGLSGAIEKIYISDGEYVIKGQELVEINHFLEKEKLLLTKQKLIETRYELELIKKELYRLQRLYKLDHATEIKLEETKFKLDQLNQALETNKQLLKMQQEKIRKALITAPISGTVLFAKDLEDGLFVNFGRQLLSIVNLDSINIQAFVNQDNAKYLNLGQKVKIRELGNDNYELTGKIVFIAPEIKKGLLKILIKLDENHPFQLGTAIKIDVFQSSIHKNLLVPIEAVRIFNKKCFVYMIENGIIKKRIVSIGKNNHFEVEIQPREGIDLESRVVVSHFDKIYEGMKVQSFEEITYGMRFK